jgi:phage baseplate assembly protein V
MDPREREKIFRKMRNSAPVKVVLDESQDGSKMQGGKYKALNGELLENVERYQNYGVSSRPLNGTEAVAVSIGGDRSHLVVIAQDDRDSRKGDMEPGEVALYSHTGDYIFLKNGNKMEMQTKEQKITADDKIESQTKEQITDATVSAEFKSPQLGIRGTVSATDYGGGPAVWRINGDVYIKGTLYIDGDVIVTGDVVAGGVSLRHHTHTGDSGGNTGEPK